MASSACMHACVHGMLDHGAAPLLGSAGSPAAAVPRCPSLTGHTPETQAVKTTRGCMHALGWARRWTVDALAQKFRIRKQRVLAILALKVRHAPASRRLAPHALICPHATQWFHACMHAASSRSATTACMRAGGGGAED